MENKRRKIADKAKRARVQSVKFLLAFQFSDKDALQRIIKGEVFKTNVDVDLIKTVH